MPNEKYRNMFGVERNGYGCERVDLYLAQLEVAFKKIREDNRNLKRELAEQNMSIFADQGSQNMFQQDNSELTAQLEQQGQYIMQLQAQLAEQQERNQRMAAQMTQMQQAVPMGEAAAQGNEAALLAQLAALRSEADTLRQQLRRQTTQSMNVMSEEEQQNLIGKVLVEARAQAEETLRTAKQEADSLTRKARKKAEEYRAEQERIHSQLQGISYGLRTILRDSAGADYQQRGEDFAAS